MFIDAWDGISGADDPAILPGMQLSGGPGGRVLHQYQMMRFDGTSWQDVGDVVDAADLAQG